jgi:hypothetical protein
MDASTEPEAGFARQVEAFHRPPHADKIEVGGFEKNVRCGLRHFRVGAAHDAGDRDGPRSVGNQEVVRRQLPELAVKRPDFLARSSGTNGNGWRLAAGALDQLIIVESMQRLAPLQHDKVGDVHDIVDRPHAGISQAPLHPGGRRADFDTFDQGGGITGG